MSKLKDITKHILKAGEVGVYKSEKYTALPRTRGCIECIFREGCKGDKLCTGNKDSIIFKKL